MKLTADTLSQARLANTEWNSEFNVKLDETPAPPPPPLPPLRSASRNTPFLRHSTRTTVWCYRRRLERFTIPQAWDACTSRERWSWSRSADELNMFHVLELFRDICTYGGRTREGLSYAQFPPSLRTHSNLRLAEPLYLVGRFCTLGCIDGRKLAAWPTSQPASQPACMCVSWA